jgi:hypothetical protein
MTDPIDLYLPVEIAPGVTKRLGDCTRDEIRTARDLAELKALVAGPAGFSSRQWALLLPTGKEWRSIYLSVVSSSATVIFVGAAVLAVRSNGGLWQTIAWLLTAAIMGLVLLGLMVRPRSVAEARPLFVQVLGLTFLFGLLALVGWGVGLA